MQNDNKIGISRRGLIIKFAEKLYKQDNVQKICKDDYMIVPVSRIDDWAHDMGVLLGESIKELLDL